MDKLTKENFWKELQEKYPLQMNKFNDWIDKYKVENNWNKLFNENYSQFNKQYASNGELVSMDFSPPKYHELPIAMQIGIFMEFASQSKGVYGVRDIQLLPEVDSDVESMHTYESMPDLIRNFFLNIKRELSYRS